LASATALDHSGANADTGVRKRAQHGVQIRDDELEPTPAARFWEASRVVWVAGTAGARTVEQQAEVCAVEHREAGGCLHLDLEAEVLRVERHGLVDVMNDVADGCHRAVLLARFETVAFRYRTLPYDTAVSQPENHIDPRIIESRHRVLTAALEELAEVGYGAFAIESVCRRSGVAKSTVYRHWPGKLPLIADALRALNIQPAPAAADGPFAANSPRERVLEIVRHLVTAFTGSTVGACTPALVDAAERDEELRALFHGYNAERRQTLVDALVDGVAAGDFPKHVDPELAAAALAGAVMYRRLMTATPLGPEDAESLTATVLGPRPPWR